MKKILFLLFCLVTFSSCDDKKDEVIVKNNLSVLEKELIVDADGDILKLTITSNINWIISDIPDWCELDKVEGNSDAEIEILFKENNYYQSRTGELKISGGNIELKLPITQAGLEKEEISLLRFPVNSFKTEGVTVSVGSNGDLDMTIEASTLFINSSIKDKIYPGNIIGGLPKECTDIKEFKGYTYNPMNVFPLAVYSIDSEKWTEPSKGQLDEYASRIIASKPKQQVSFIGGSPDKFYSHQQLAAWSLANIGLDFPQIIKGKSYREEEMTKGGGLLYTYALVSFEVMMELEYEFRGQLLKNSLEADFIKENDLQYVRIVNYGRTAYMIVESDYNIDIVKSLVNRVAGGGTLMDEDLDILEACDIYYLYFTNDGEVHLKKGDNLSIIKEYNESVSTNDIMPLSFSVSKLSNHASGTIKYSLTLPK